MTETRLNDLEIRLAHQERVIADLNDVVTTQWKKIETLERRLQRLDEEVQALDSGDAPAANQKPPHY